MRAAVFVSCAILVVAAIFAYAQDAPENVASNLQPRATIRGELPPLFDFARYKQIFHKHYGSLVEELSRRALFIPRAIKVLVSGVRYMYRKQNYYTAINFLTDRTPDEIKRMSNKQQDFAPPSAFNRTAEPKGFLIDLRDESVAKKVHVLQRPMPNAASMISTKTMQSESPAKIVHDQERKPPRHLDLSDMIEDGQGKKANPPKPQSLREQMINPSYLKFGEGINDPDTRQRLFDSQRALLRIKVRAQMLDAPAVKDSKPVYEDENDMLFVDHSQGGCMDLPRKQGDCGSCWTFSAVAIHEWLQCQKSGKLVRLSEQYIIDCANGPMGHDQPGGCEGGSFLDILNFTANFGLELRSDYPYQEKDDICPYPETQDIQTTGYFRFDGAKAFMVPFDLWDELLFFGPIYVVIATQNTDFDYYARGVHDLKNCAWNLGETHAMVLVGQGMQDGVEYWKLRNSYSVGWGEEGYYRVSKNYMNCFHYYGYSFMTENGHEFMLDKIKRNPRHHRSTIRRRYWQKAAQVT